MHVKADTIKRLLDLNRQFYQTFAAQFSATRMRLQPGVKNILAKLPVQATILDLGCGNGEVWRALQAAEHKGAYVGLDYSAELLEIAAANSKLPEEAQTKFIQADISTPDWDSRLPRHNFDVILAFAVLHHVPSHALRSQILRKLRALVTPEGIFIHSEWQFLSSPRLRKRVQPWGSVGISEEQLEAGDYLLDWRQGGYGLRYVHHFDQDELARLARESGFRITETFRSDGEGGRLGLYQVWKPI
jgi:2-polyprenyl-3-methyl-5-hydroxy-6-metoxy-1,4-benzoquinol methylase